MHVFCLAGCLFQHSNPCAAASCQLLLPLARARQRQRAMAASPAPVPPQFTLLIKACQEGDLDAVKALWRPRYVDVRGQLPAVFE